MAHHVPRAARGVIIVGLVFVDPESIEIPMAWLPLRRVPLPAATARAYDDWLQGLERELDDPSCDRNLLCRRILTEIYYPHLADADRAKLPEATRIALLQMDPRNVTLEPEYYHELDPDKYYRVKPLLWLWEMFDKSPLGENVHLGVLFRRVLARRIFRKCGKNFKAFHFVKLSFGYNIEVGDGVVVHRHVLLDDRGGIRIGNGSSVADFANIYSHTHDLVDPHLIETPTTIIEDGVRITYHATVLAGVHVAKNSMVGALGVVTRDTEPDTLHVGIPAKAVKKKPETERRKGPPDALATG
ncbi:MAG: acyltransferase [Gemmatimonadetes bacterium]|nr:acyltransferase [Gemmatimonadota bacterium]